MAEKSEIRLLIVDDHPVVREGVIGMVSADEQVRIVAEASSGQDGIEQYFRCRPDVTIVDLLLPDLSGIEVIKRILGRASDARILVLTSLSGDEDIYRAIELGVRGYLFKDMVRKDLVHAIRAIHRGERFFPPTVGAALADGLPRTQLSLREIEVLKLVAMGKRNKDIAYDLGLSEATINAHIKHILEKLNASDRTHAVTTGLRRGIIKL